MTCTAKFEKKISPGFNCYLFSVIYEFSNYNLKQTITHIADKRAFGHYGRRCNKFIKRESCLLFKKEFGFEDVCFIFDRMMDTELKIALIDDAFYYYNCKNTSSKIANFKRLRNLKKCMPMFIVESTVELTKMLFLEIFVAVLFDKQRPFFMSLRITIKTLIKLWRYLPAVIRNQNRGYILSESIAQLVVEDHFALKEARNDDFLNQHFKTALLKVSKKSGSIFHIWFQIISFRPFVPRLNKNNAFIVWFMLYFLKNINHMLFK